MTMIIWIILSVVFLCFSIFMYICIGFMMLFFERTIKHDVDGKSYSTVYENLLFKKSGKIHKNDSNLWIRDYPEFKEYESKLQNIVIAFWPCFAVAETINHYIQHNK